jgi:hypothetical protein
LSWYLKGKGNKRNKQKLKKTLVFLAFSSYFKGRRGSGRQKTKVDFFFGGGGAGGALYLARLSSKKKTFFWGQVSHLKGCHSAEPGTVLAHGILKRKILTCHFRTSFEILHVAVPLGAGLESPFRQLKA